MSSGQPKISVCVPTYSHARYLGQALHSVLSQTLLDFEVIVYDDASSDATQQVVAGVRDPRLRYFRQPHHVGVARNRNSCLAVARGQYIAWLDADDLYHPEMLAVQSAVLDGYPRVGLVHGAYELIDGEGRRLPDWPQPFGRDVVEPGGSAFRELVLANYVTAPTVLVRRACYDQVGQYATDLGSSSTDWEMWLRIALHADLAYTATVVAQYRQHEGSISAQTVKSGERLRCDIAAIRRIFTWQCALVPDAARLQLQARAALAAKALIYAGDAFTLGRRGAALTAALRGLQVAGGLLPGRYSWRWLLSILQGDEYGNYRSSKALLGQLYPQLEGTRYGNRIQNMALVVPEWEETLRQVAQTVRRLVPPGARVAAVDKYDPTLLRLSQREGWHFPDRRLLPGGYPRDSATAIKHLEELRRRGAGYLVFPQFALWWLDYYHGFRQYLETSGQRIWRDAACVIYRLPQGRERW